MLNCLTKHYADLWSEIWRDDFKTQTWSIDDDRLHPFSTLQRDWSWATPLRNYFERRQALVEIDVIAAMALGLSLQDLEMIYTIQFPVLQQNENDTWYDRKGNIVFTCSKGLTGVGVDRPVWEQIRNMKEGETYDVEIEYKHGNGNFAMFRGDICERVLADFTDLAKEVSQADAIIVIGGISAQMEGEGGDKADIELPKVQRDFLRALKDAGKTVIFVNCSGSAIAFGSVEGEYDALLQAWYAGQGGAKALADVLFGDYNPGGKLPVTFYRSNDDLPDFLDYSMKNRTYRYFTGQPQYAFGYGLSYTSFAVGKGRLSAKTMKKDGRVTLTVPVSNTGTREGTETIQVYVKAFDDAGAPIKELKGFQKLSLAAGQTAKATITLDGEAFEYYNEMIDELSVRPGRYQILYGTSSRDEDLQSLDFTVR